jgi:arsenate reductase (glutaredoxin)
VIQIFGHPKCKATRAAQRFFAERRIQVQSVDITEKALSKGELESVARAVGVNELLDRDGVRFKEKGLAHAALSAERIKELALTDPLLLRTPVVRNGQKATVGAAENVWKEWVAALKR